MDKRGFHRPSKTEDICVQQEKGKVKINNVQLSRGNSDSKLSAFYLEASLVAFKLYRNSATKKIC